MDIEDKYRKEIDEETDRVVKSPAAVKDAVETFKKCLVLAEQFKYSAIQRKFEPNEFIVSLIVGLELCRDRSPDKTAFDSLMKITTETVRELIQARFGS